MVRRHPFEIDMTVVLKSVTNQSILSTKHRSAKLTILPKRSRSIASCGSSRDAPHTIESCRTWRKNSANLRLLRMRSLSCQTDGELLQLVNKLRLAECLLKLFHYQAS